MNRNKAERILEERFTRPETRFVVARANRWPSVATYCEVMGWKPKDCWACSVLMKGQVYEPSMAYRTIDDLVATHLHIGGDAL